MRIVPVRFGIVIVGLCAAFGLGIGCMTQPPTSQDDPGAAQPATSETEQNIGGGGGSSCSPPRDDCPTFPPQDCSGKAFCYCACRVQHPCARVPSQCGALSQCLNSCDANNPSWCPGGGNPNPTTMADCL